MHLNHYADVGARALSAAAIVLAMGYVFDHGHSMSLAGVLYLLLGA